MQRRFFVLDTASGVDKGSGTLRASRVATTVLLRTFMQPQSGVGKIKLPVRSGVQEVQRAQTEYREYGCRGYIEYSE